MRGETLFNEQELPKIKLILIVGYLVFCGIMIGYLISSLRIGRTNYKDHEDREKIAIKNFILGIVLGIILAVIYLLY